MYNIPILVIAFNRPEPLRDLVAVLNRLNPVRVYLAQDGPRPDRNDETAIVAVRAQFNELQAPEAKRLFRTENLGCKHAVSSAIDWFFSNEEQGIILEDDILPSLDFFFFAKELLLKYKDDDRVSMISGYNAYTRAHKLPGSYRFSSQIPVWGWATWRRAWEHFDVSISDWPSYRSRFAIESSAWLNQDGLKNFWLARMDEVYSGKIDTWDYQWTLSCWRNRGLCAVPNYNLVVNQGFGPEATHTIGRRPRYVPSRFEALAFPLQHPNIVEANREADDFVYALGKPSRLGAIKSRLYSTVSKLTRGRI